MGKYSAGKQWEDLNRKRQEAEDQELEAQKAAANEAVRAHVAGSRARFYRRQDDCFELEAQDDPPLQYREQAPLTPPDSDSEYPEVDSDENIRHLQKEVIQKESEIKRLESEVEVEKDKRRRLQAERHKAVDAQRRAEDEVCKLKRKVANLDQLLDGSIKRQKELESELDVSRQEARELKRQLHEERCDYESHIRVQETRERQIRQQLEDSNSVLETCIGRGRRLDQDVQSTLEREVQHVPTRPRRQHKGTARKAYISVPKPGNRRALWVLS
ncbi:MAG: hypothetical protein Q9175_002638 [Cornicularia normoerica]